MKKLLVTGGLMASTESIRTRENVRLSSARYHRFSGQLIETEIRDDVSWAVALPITA